MKSVEKQVDQQRRIANKMELLIRNDPHVSALKPIEAVAEAICEPGLTLAETMDRAFSGYQDRPAVGARDYDIVQSGRTDKSLRNYKSSFKILSYATFQQRIHALATVWNGDSVHRVQRDECVCIFGFTSVDFTVIDFATAYVQAISVPLQNGSTHTDVTDIFDSVRPVVVAVTVNDLISITPYVAENDYIRSLVVFDYEPLDDRDLENFNEAQSILDTSGSDTRIISLQDLEKLGDGHGWKYLPTHPEGAERTASIVYSSGSTGQPKAAMITEKAIRFYWISMAANSPPMISVCLAPFSHLLGKGVLVSVLRQGGTACFTLAPDMSTLFEDIRIVRPTFLGVFPRIIELIYQHYQNEVARYSRESGVSEQQACEEIKREMKDSYLGDRLCVSLFGGSLVSPAVKDFFMDCFDVLLLDTYGNTEGGQVAVNGFIQRPPVIEYKLRDVPELGYYANDKPFPRGELCFKSIQSTKGYHNASEATLNLFDEDGFVCTGDIVEEYEQDHIAIIDRRNDVLKLSQGEFVAIGALAAIFEGGSDLIDQIYLYGNSQYAYLLAVIVPNPQILSIRMGNDPSEETVKQIVRSELQRVALEKGIRSFEVPREFIVEDEPFSEANGLLSSLRKKMRPALERKYKRRLESLYAELEKTKKDLRRALTDPTSPLDVFERLVRLLEADLNIKAGSGSESASFYQLGGDSLGAVLFSHSIQEIFGVTVPADMILSPTGCLRKWAYHIEEALAGENCRPSFASVHGETPSVIHSSDMALSNLIDDETLRNAAALPDAVVQARTVFITGANGFLGRFVCLAWLEKLAPVGGKVVCMVRAADDNTARERLDSVFRGTDRELECRFDALARDHLEVLAGDVGERQLGLAEAEYRRLSTEVDRIVHVAALVNHRLSYANLFGANVMGTAEIIRFALTDRKKSVDFVSTVAVYPLLDSEGAPGENSTLRDTIQLSDTYAAGYGASKWAGEHLMRNVQRRYGIPVNIFRGDMMLPHQVFRGQANIADIFIRLIFSIVKTGIAPYSFYPLAEDGVKSHGHYDGLPVDVVAAAIVGAPASNVECRTYHVQNYHEGDGCSLDAFVDWIEAAGYSVTRIDDYKSWYEAFRGKLSRLPARQKQHSALEVIEAFAVPQSGSNQFRDCAHFKSLVNELTEGRDVPHLSKNYIEKCLRDMCLLGLIEAPVDSHIEVEQ